MESADDLFLEVLFARMRGDDGLAFGIRKVMVSDAEHVGLDTGGHQRHLGLLCWGMPGVVCSAMASYTTSMGASSIPCGRRNSLAALALATSKRSVALRYCFVRPIS